MTTTKIAPPDARRVIADLKELAKLTSTPDGAQRLAWGPVWRKARTWFTQKVKKELGLTVRTDSAGNNWVTIPGKSSQGGVIIGGHLDSVPNGGWLDGCLGVLAGLEVLRRRKAAGMPPVPIHLVDWADEEGARFGRSLVGSSAAGGSLNPQKEIANLKDRTGVTQGDALKENGVDLKTMLNAHKELKALKTRAYLELHIEQGPVLKEMKRPTATVLGTFGCERNLIRFYGQPAHSGSTPIPYRRDAFLAAAEFALECRKIGLKFSGNSPVKRVVCTCGVVKVEPCAVTINPGFCEISLDQRALDAKVLAKMLAAAKNAAKKAAAKNKCRMEWVPLWTIDPRLFDKTLVKLSQDAIKEVTGQTVIIPSGPLHDAAEMVPHMPTVMMFAKSDPGLSHCKEEDTPIKDLDLTIRSFLRLADKTVEHLG
jgi:allantoate deiminase